MSIDRKKLYILSSALAPTFLLVCFIQNTVTRRFVLTAVVGAALAAVYILIKKHSALSIQKRQVLWVLPAFGFLGIILLYMLGLRLGYYRTAVNAQTFLYSVLPFTLIIISSELVRARLLMQNDRVVNILTACSFIICDIAMQYDVSPAVSFTQFVNFFGRIVFPCAASGILYGHVSKRHGSLPVILYRLLITLYSILIPFYPAISTSLVAFIKIVFPIAAMLFVGMLYERRKESFSRKKARIQTCLSATLVVLMAAAMMLISCQFKYALLVVATESMTGSIDKGDAVIYEEYNGQNIVEGQVLVFEKDESVYIHRVVKIEKINGQVRYTTKGDANDGNDNGFITRENIIGLTDITIKYVGHPTLWMRQMFSGS